MIKNRVATPNIYGDIDKIDMAAVKKRRYIVSFILLPFLYVLSVFLACAFGSSTVPIEKVILVLKQELFGIVSEIVTPSDMYIVWNLRFPRALLALAAGGGLAVAGAAMQSVTKNVMADPYVLGISSGALAFVSIGFMIGGTLLNTKWFLPLLAFGGALFALLMVFAVGGFSNTSSPARLVLSGLAVSITLNAVGQYGIYNAKNISSSNAVVSWMMGSLGGSRWADVWIPILSSLLGTAFFLFNARSFDLMALGDETAISLGVNTRHLKRLAFIVVAMMCGVSVASCGIIGLVGFMVPHMVRFITGTEHRRVFPLSFLVGGMFLVCMDILARIILAPSELPIGILTALCGGPYFVWLLRKSKERG